VCEVWFCFSYLRMEFSHPPSCSWSNSESLLSSGFPSFSSPLSCSLFQIVPSQGCPEVVAVCSAFSHTSSPTPFAGPFFKTPLVTKVAPLSPPSNVSQVARSPSGAGPFPFFCCPSPHLLSLIPFVPFTEKGFLFGGHFPCPTMDLSLFRALFAPLPLCSAERLC